MNNKQRIVDFQATDRPELSELVAAIKRRRGGHLLNLDRMLLHSEPLASGWNVFMGKVRESFSVDPLLRELSMCGVAVLNEAEYEFMQHAPLFLKLGGTQAQLDALRLLGSEGFERHQFTPLLRDTAELTLQMTRHIKVESGLMQRLQSALGNTALVELVSTIAAYNMVSRFLIALDVTPE